ncbi:hypothetical protein A9Q78_05395 [Methylophaga sp. 41_12_T18]|nr:hypothetical protein A9Q78_05395 [Methylophaga sp. 41_12_T18]
MVDISKNLNSKRFLFTYLVIIGFLLVLLMNRLPLVHEDLRDIPSDMLSYLESPPRPLPSFALLSKDQQVLTQDWFIDKWSFVYFTHGNCHSSCKPALTAMNTLQAAFANKDFQFLMIGLDGENETAESLATILNSQQLNFNVAVTDSPDQLDDIARSFIALFLKTKFSNGQYMIEQEHHIFVVDPKGRVYATFKRLSNVEELKEKFLKMRYFYARSEN